MAARRLVGAALALFGALALACAGERSVAPSLTSPSFSLQSAPSQFCSIRTSWARARARAINRPSKVARGQKQNAIPPQSIMECAEDVLLQMRIEIDQEVPANDQVQLREGRVLDDTVRREDACFPDALDG